MRRKKNTGQKLNIYGKLEKVCEKKIIWPDWQRLNSFIYNIKKNMFIIKGRLMQNKNLSFFC